MNDGILKALIGGVAGTLVMTLVGLYGAPMMGIPAMNPADMLAGQMGGSLVAGWVGHLMIGMMLAVGYTVVFAARIPGPPVARGAIFSLIPWLMAQVMVMPMMGMPLFSGDARMAMGSLIGHLVYGAILGAVVGEVAATRAVRAAA